MEVQALLPQVVKDNVVSDVTALKAHEILPTFGSNCIDLISRPLGSRIVAVSDEWFAAAENLITPTPPISKPGVFTYAGAWYDGWETRRHNQEDSDWVVLRLGVTSGRVRGVEIDTGFFNGNQAPEISVDGCFVSDAVEDDLKDPNYTGWEPILGRQPCGPACRQAWLLCQGSEVTKKPFTHVRLRMHPDGGIGRFRLYGEAIPVFPNGIEDVLELSAAVNGGIATRCSDQHFGVKDNLLMPGRGENMGSGWETKRSRGVHVDWVIVQLGAPGTIESVIVDTAFFRGNFPQKVQIFAAEGVDGEPDANDSTKWTELLKPSKCGPDQEHIFGKNELESVEAKVYRYVKMVIHPDGGVMRLRVFGRRVGAVEEKSAVETVKNGSKVSNGIKAIARGDAVNGTAAENSVHATVESASTNGTHTTNGSASANGTYTNGSASTNGMHTTNGSASTNGTHTNGLASTNGTHTTNGSETSNGIHITNGSTSTNGTHATNGASSSSAKNGVHTSNGTTPAVKNETITIEGNEDAVNGTSA